ncbi:FAD-binding protein [Holdemania massiliensis]|uniref:FAD-binding protein n=1 Tax=Holdemania massiliensis TaxID=1468449 RepID=UPI001F06A23A|nr:FAD-binding protein [Holdemania massiliensis]MCH1941420.1 FAD-binding protein [Holdemania massiliensis]
MPQRNMKQKLSRRDFLKGTAAGAVSLAAAGMLSGCNAGGSRQTPELSYADTIKWDGVYDVLVMGFGGAGATAAHYAAEEGADVLLFDAAPQGHEGGNTRYAGQFCVVGHDKEKLMTYYKALYGGLPYDEELLDTFTSDLLVLGDRMIQDYGASELMYWKGIPATAWAIPEFPELEGGDTIDSFSVHKGASDGALWRMLREKVVNRDQIDIWFNTRGQKLIQDPETKRILGMMMERNGELLNIRALRGVVMACGGFENNSQMVADYLGLAISNPRGTLYNRGDGVAMALEVNADLWHMDCFESLDILGGHCISLGEGTQAMQTSGFKEGGSFILVGPDGSRYLNETEYSRHGHLYHCGEYHLPSYPQYSYLIFDEKMKKQLEAENLLEVNHSEVWVSADSYSQLASFIGAKEEVLLSSIRKYNAYCAKGEDEECGRDPEKMQPLAEGTCYAMKMNPLILNTQGGARRNARAEVLDIMGNPIPNLYSAGEFGGMTAKNYQGATNLSECLVFGRIAGIHAAQVKEKEAAYTLRQAVESPMTYKIGSSDEIGGSAGIELKENEYLGMSPNGMGGDVQVKVTMDGDRIVSVDLVQHSETAGISDPAIEQIPAQIVAQQSTDVDLVSGATITSKAIIAAVQDALSQIK